MQIETLKDVLHWTQQFHHNLSECLSHCEDKNVDERARIMLDYLSVRVFFACLLQNSDNYRE